MKGKILTTDGPGWTQIISSGRHAKKIEVGVAGRVGAGRSRGEKANLRADPFASGRLKLDSGGPESSAFDAVGELAPGVGGAGGPKEDCFRS
jgi:hypothetical protein